MLEILYRIYEVSDKIIPDDERPFGFQESLSKIGSHEITMDCIACESRQQFKEIIKDAYGEDIKFAYSRKYPVGTIYCIIIGEHCYDSAQYFTRIEYTCACCGSNVRGFIKGGLRLEDYEVRNDLCNQFDKYADLRFCSYKCKMHFIERERKKCLDDGMIDDSYISRDTFQNTDISGYIYKISKKSTGEFYVGQTIYVPVFRWAQHLKTERFDISGILDYKFEVIEVVSINQNILEREKYWIQKCYNECPDKSLNIMCIPKTDGNQISFDTITGETDEQK